MDGFGSPSSSSALKARYPMYVIPVKKLMQMNKFLIHREMMERNLLQEYTPETEGRVIVVSHQWLSYNHPDPDQEHFFTLKRLLDRLGNGEVHRVEEYWRHAVMFRSAGITAREWKNEFENTFVWIDYCCIPQVEVDMDPRTVTLSGLAVQSIAAYVERASLLLVLAPICVHKDSQQACNFSSWRKRGWCRLEMMSALLSAGMCVSWFARALRPRPSCCTRLKLPACLWAMAISAAANWATTWVATPWPATSSA